MNSSANLEKIITLVSYLNMSAHNFYLEKGYTALTKSCLLSGGGTHSVWIPKVGHRVVVTAVNISSIDVAGTIAFYFDNGNDRISMFSIAASASIVPPFISGWESTVVSGRIFANKAAIQSGGLMINLEGFEIPCA